MTLPPEILGALLAVCSTLTFSASSSVLSRPLLKSDPVAGNLIGLAVGVVISGALALALGQITLVASLSLLLIALLAVVGLFHFNIARILIYTSMKQIGANQATTLSATQVIWSVVLAVIFLSESLTIPIAVGATMIGLGIIIMRFGQGAKMRGGRAKLGAETGLLAAAIYGVTPIIIKYALSLFPYFATATFVAYLFAFLSYLPRIRTMGLRDHLATMSGGAIKAYAASGLFLAVAQLARFGALDVAPVVLVAPLLTLYPLFIPLMTWRLARDVEHFQPRTIAGIALCVAGSLVVSLA
jgi:drug/metabolite transporter (DMT)-like permease